MGRLISNVIFTAHKPSQWGSSEETDVQAGFGSMDSVRRPTHGSVRCGDRRASIVICNHAHALCEQLLLLLLRSPAEQCGGHPVCAIYTDKCISYFERVVCDRFVFVLFFNLFLFVLFAFSLLPCHTGSHGPSSEDLFAFLERGCCYARS